MCNNKNQNSNRADFPGFVLEELHNGADFDSDGSERQAAGLTGGLGDVDLDVACLTAISAAKRAKIPLLPN